MQNKKPPLAGGEKENDKMELILKGAPGELFVFGTAQKAPAEEPSCTPSAPKNQSEQHKDMSEPFVIKKGFDVRCKNVIPDRVPTHDPEKDITVELDLGRLYLEKIKLLKE